MSLNSRESQESKKSLSDFDKFIIDNIPEMSSMAFRTKIFFLVSTVSVFFALFTENFSHWWVLLSLILAIFGWFDARHNKNKALDFCAFYSPKGHSHNDHDYEYFLETVEKFSANNTEIPFSKLLPAKDEKDFGFSCIYDYEMSAETAFVSSDIDNKLILSTNIPIRIALQTKKFVSEQSNIRYRQMVYLATKICSKGNYRVLNDEKICFETSIAQLNGAIQQKATVKLSKVGYFDGLITNEAFRSKIREKIKNAADVHSALYANLTTEFPALLNRQEKSYYLKPLPVPKISHHIGISTIAITSDKQIIYFTQKMNNMIGAGLLVASGSGSSDFADIHKCKDPKDLKAVIEYGMARELCEEGGILGRLSRDNLRQFIMTVANQTLLTGFFRWVDRCGKPEFVGITKLDLSLNDIPGDNFEVYKSSISPNWELEKLSDFNIFKNDLRNSGQKLSLSFYIALERLIKIASYEHSNNNTERNIFCMVNNFIFPKK